MTDAISRIPALIEQGKKFTFENFSTKSRHGYPNAYSADWLVWAHHAGEVVREIGQSSSANSIARGLGIEMIGEDADKFESGRSMILSGLEAAAKILGDRAVPASDRFVTLGHNSLEQKQAIEKIDELVKAVSETNDLPGSAEDRDQIISELSAARKLFDASKVRVASVRAMVEPSVKWLMEKAAGSIVGKLATGLWDYLVGLHFF